MTFSIFSGQNGGIDFGTFCVGYSVAAGAASIAITISAGTGVI